MRLPDPYFKPDGRTCTCGGRKGAKCAGRMSKQYWMDRLDNDGDFGTLAADAERKGMDVYAQNEDRDAAPSGDTSVIELTQKCLTRF